MPACADRAAIAGVDRLHRVGRADDPADLHVVVQERHELAPRVLPQADDRRILGAPRGGELHEPFLGRGLGRGGVNRPDVFGDLIPVLARCVAKGVAQQMNHAGLDDRGPSPYSPPRAVPSAPSQTTMHTSPVPRFLISVTTDSQNFAPSPPSPAHNPRMSRSPAQVTPTAT